MTQDLPSDDADQRGASDAAAPGAQARSRPLCVDLDGTLALQDSLHEVIWKAATRRPLATALAVFKGLSDRAEMKRRLAEIWTPRPEEFRWRAPLIEALREERAKGRTILLATGADQSIADIAASELGLFDDAIGAKDGVNLTGPRKAAALVERFGHKGFDYVGDSRADLEVWPAAHEAWLAGGKLSPARVERETGVRVARRFEAPMTGGLRAWVKALRVYQWVKNGLVFIPALAAGAIFEPAIFLGALAAFFCFSLCASGGYLINDLVDIDADRRHPRKRERPFAGGRLSMLAGAAGAVALIGGGMAGAMLVGAGLFAVLTLYLIVSFVYSFWLKRAAMFDVFTLAGLYCLRLLAGGAATGITLSVWLLSFCGFLFLSLACLKRVGELVGTDAEAKSLRRGYLSGDAAVLAALGLAIGVASSIILTLYIVSPQAQMVYAAPGYLWGVAPFYILWLSRLWLMAWRGRVKDDPIVTVLTDPASWMLALFGVLLLALAHGAPPGLSWSDFHLGF